MDKTTLRLVLVILFDLASHHRSAHLERVAGRAGLSLAATREALAALERATLVDASKVRLTMAGLAVAASVVEARSAMPRASIAA
jgi:DNA-binding IclR family transcriptional regulator